MKWRWREFEDCRSACVDDYLHLTVYKDPKSLQRWLWKQRRRFMVKSVDGIVAFTHAKGRGDPFIEHVSLYFCEGCIDIDTVAHECLHATSVWAERMKIKPENMLKWQHRDHERIANYHGRLVAKVWKELNRK
jgi:hypothetical protein